MSGALLVVVPVGFCSIAAYAASLTLVRRVALSSRSIALACGFAPTAIILAALIIAHIIWMARHAGGYSPLVFVIYGFWLVVLNLFFNLAEAGAAAGAAARSR